ncbi:unnamed protein product [Rhizophagus irregularis]|nr:unnamed protein product [Rhizophagus irregularis]
MLETNNEGINIKAFISDSAEEYTAARKQLRREYLNKVFLPCMAHQMNLVFGDIFKESIHYKRTSTEAVALKYISAKFNEHRSNVIRTNGIPNVIPNNTSNKNNNEQKLPDDIADII